MGALYPKLTFCRWSRAAGGRRHDRAGSWWTSTRSRGRRRRHQVAAIGLQLAGAGIERGGRWPRPGCRRSAGSAGGRRRDRAAGGAGTRLPQSACSWPAPASSAVAAGHDQVAGDRRAAGGRRRDRAAGGAGTGRRARLAAGRRRHRARRPLATTRLPAIGAQLGGRRRDRSRQRRHQMAAISLHPHHKEYLDVPSYSS